jgi:2-amino-4-hydroxy-6-hydroxymethyldihydropteridine diphosphokinase
MRKLPACVYIGLGANLGDRRANLRLALDRLRSVARLEEVSSLYETAPQGFVEQPLFYNAVCRVTTHLEPEPLLHLLKDLERRIGRRPGGPSGGPRPIDLDILLYGERVVDTPALKVPHPGLPERAFVLVPMCELAPDQRHPLLGSTMQELLDALEEQGVRKIARRGWETTRVGGEGGGED